MKIKLFNSSSRELEIFTPLKPGQVSIYTCGPTVYNYPHIGNWTAFIYWDILVRMLLANDLQVNRTINITDVGHLTSDADDGEDKLLAQTKKEKKTAWEIARFYTDYFLENFQALNLTPPTHFARATDFIPRQLEMIRILKQKGYTYQTSDGLYFDTSLFPTYADFARLNIDSLKAGARVDFNPEKKNPTDFALWKFSKPDEKRDMEWLTPSDLLDNPSELKTGFPGWHLECSAIIKATLGDTIDIHAGGIDHIPIHHTNEIAQSEATNGVKLANFWLHCEFLNSNGKKISKSFNNGYRLEDLIEKGFTPLDFKLFVIQGHYRNQRNFTFKNLQSATNRLKNWRNVAVIRHQIHSRYQEESSNQSQLGLLTASNAILQAVNNDLDTPQALAIIDDIFNKIDSSPLDKIPYDQLMVLLELIDQLFGLQLLSTTPDMDDKTKQLLIKRQLARQQNDWATSDQIRDQLKIQGYQVKDTSNDSRWQYL